MLSLVFIPIIIHFFNFKRRKKIFFTNIWFLQSVRNKTKSYSTLKKLVVLFLRILFIVWAVIAILDPILNDSLSDARQSEVSYLDTSPSMSMTNDKNLTLLEEGYDFLKLGEMEKGSLITNQNVYTSIDRVKSDFGTDGLQNDYKLINDRLTAKYSSSQWISDFQKNNGEIEKILNDSSHQYELVLVPQNASTNLFIDSVFLSKPIGYGTSNSLEIILSNSGDTQFENQILTVEKDKRQLATIPFSIKANSLEKVVLNLSENEDLSGNYKLVLNDASVTFDNQFYFSIQSPEKIAVTIISFDEPNKYLISALGNNEIFVLESKNITEVSNEDIQKSNFLILDHLQKIPDWIISELDNYIGSILVVPSTDFDENSYRSLLKSSMDIKKEMSKTNISSQSLNNPIFNGLFKGYERLSLPFFSREILPKSNLYSTVIDGVNGDNYLTRNDNLFFLGSELNKSKTNIMDHAFFVPLIYAIAQDGVSNSEMFYRIGQKQMVIKQPNDNLTLVSLINSSDNFVLNYREDGGNLILDIPEDISSPGLYYLVQENDTLAAISMNYPKAESNMDYYTVEELRTAFGGRNNVSVSSINEATLSKESVILSKDEIPLWKYALVLAIVFLLAEAFVLRFVK